MYKRLILIVLLVTFKNVYCTKNDNNKEITEFKDKESNEIKLINNTDDIIDYTLSNFHITSSSVILLQGSIAKGHEQKINISDMDNYILIQVSYKLVVIKFLHEVNKNKNSIKIIKDLFK